MYFVHGTRLADCFARNIAILISRSTVVDTYAASRIILVKSRKCAELFAPDLSVGFRRHQAVGPPLVLAGPPCWSTRQRPSYEAVDETQATLEDEPREARRLQMYCCKRGDFQPSMSGPHLVESNKQQIYGISKGFFPYNSAVFGLAI